MKIAYKVWTGDYNPRLLAEYKIEKAAKKFAYKHTLKYNVRTEVIELIKERGEEPYGNLIKTYWPKQKSSKVVAFLDELNKTGLEFQKRLKETI